jgi:hypothetical protein
MSKTPLRDWPGSIPRQRFDNLLWTWHVEVHRRRIPIQLEDWITPDGQLDDQALEGKYGIEGAATENHAGCCSRCAQNKPARVGFDQI